MGGSINMNYLEITKEVFNGLGSIGVLIVVIVLYNLGLLKKNGNGNGNGQLAELKAQLDILENNHLVHLDAKLDKMLEILTEIKVILRERE